MMRLGGTARAQGEDGYTLVEVVMAMFVIVTVMTAMLGVLISSLSTVAQARQRQTATALATRAMESMRALPYDSITLPDGTTPDPQLEYVAEDGGAYYFRPGDLLPEIPAAGELLVVTDAGTRRETVLIDDVSYVVQSYVTKPDATPAGQQVFNLTVLVSWTSTVSPNGRTTAQRSVAYSPSGCLSTAQNPFAAPCQAHFTAQSGQTPGGFTITRLDPIVDPVTGNTEGPDTGIWGFGDTSELLELSMVRQGSTVLVQQIASGTATAVTSGARNHPDPLISTPLGGSSALAAVDSDPSTPEVLYNASAIATGASGTRILTGTAGTLTASLASGDSGASSAGIAAEPSQCSNVNGDQLVTGASGQRRPCASARVRQGGTEALTYHAHSEYGFNDLSVPLVVLESGFTDLRAVSAQLAAVNTNACSDGSGPGLVGCSYAAAGRDLGFVTVGRADSELMDVEVLGASVLGSWNNTLGLVSVHGLDETAVAEEGEGARTPTYSRTGHIHIWNGAGYDWVDLSAFASPPSGGQAASQAWAIPATETVYVAPSGIRITIVFEGSVTVQRPQLEYEPASRSGSLDDICQEGCLSRLNGGGAVLINLNVQIFKGPEANPIKEGQFALAGDLGGLVAQATYKVAPDVE